jgi:Fe-S oxidoreductase
LTLGAKLLLHERPRARGLAVIGLGDLDEAIGLVGPILDTRPSAVELLDDLILSLARANAEYQRYVRAMPSPARGSDLKAVLYVEYVGASAEEMEDRFAALSRTIDASRAPTCGTPVFHRDSESMLGAWKLRKAGEPLLHGVPGRRKPVTFIEDNAVPVERLDEFVRRLREIVTRHGTIASFWAHASVGVLHVRPLLDIHDEGDRERMRTIAVEAADLARELGGVMSGEHGDGRVRGPLLERFYGAELMGAFREVKAIFDPCNLLNPGNIVDLGGERAVGAAAITQHLRVEPSPGRAVTIPRDLSTFYSYEREHGFDGAVEMCNGAGLCRKKQGGTMCPSYMATLDERHSTRGRGNALRLAISGQLGSGFGLGTPSWSDSDTIQTLDLCLSCKACKSECPSNVDVAKLKSEYLAQGYAKGGAPLRAHILGAVRAINRLASLVPGLANFTATFAPTASLLRMVLGTHQRRTLPRMERSLAKRWEKSSAGGQGEQAPRVVLFGDCFTMYSEASIGLSTRRVLEAFGYRVELADAGCCGRAKISLGVLAGAIEEIDATLARLQPLIDDTSVRAILVAEPSCLSAMKDDWLSLKVRTSREERERLAAKAFMPEEFLHRFWGEHPRRPMFREPAGEVVLHAHCHQKALWGAGTSAEMLRRVAGAKLRVLDSGCCGMAGAFGYARHRFDLSMKIGELSLLPEARRLAPGAVLCAPGTSCRHQVHDGATKTALHPMQVIERLLDVGAGSVASSSLTSTPRR